MNTAPIEKKVGLGSFAAIATGLATWVLTNWVFRGPIPPDLAAVLPALTAWLAGSVTAYAAPHTPRDPGQAQPLDTQPLVEDVTMRVVTEMDRLLAARLRPATPPPPAAVSTLPPPSPSQVPVPAVQP